jgi:hypothetical protein
MTNKEITQLKLMIIGSVVVLLLSFVGSALISYGAINVRMDNLEKQDARIIEQHNRDIDKMQSVISAVVEKQSK